MGQDETNILRIRDFAKLFGTKEDDISKVCRKIIKENNFCYQKLSAQKQAEIISHINNKIKKNEFFTAGKNAKSIWEKRWSGQLKNFKISNFQTETLVPEYFNKPNHETYFRFYGDFIKPLDKNFEFNWLRVYRNWLFGKYFKNYDNIYDFGCGSGINTVLLANLFPKKNLHCLDWVSSSKNIANLLAKKYGWKVSGHVFDIFNPNYNLKVRKNSAFLTYTSLEQTGIEYKAFVEFAIKKEIDLFVTVDSFDELYDKNIPFDSLAVRFAKKRNYLRNYLSYLRKLENQRKIKILKTQRVRFGSIYQDNNSYVVWQPIKS